jgi:hypothetical protein
MYSAFTSTQLSPLESCIRIYLVIIDKFNINIGIIESPNEIYCHQLVKKT